MISALRLLIEAIGAGLIIAALGLVSLPLGMLVGGIIMVLAANYYYVGSSEGDDDAGTE